jgi:hypothetical protein
MKKLLSGLLGVCLLGGAGGAASWEVASFTPSAISPRLPSAEQAVALTEGSRAPLWWLRRPHRVALTLGWIGMPARDQQARRLAGVEPAGGVQMLPRQGE